jgi:dihydroxyacid dehydratase/phosphogluconate dehydratase
MEGKRRSRVFSDPDPLSCIRRSMLYACGLTYEEIKRPLVAVSESLRRFAGPARVFNSEEEALVEDGDTVEIDVDRRSINLNVAEATLEKRRENLVPPPKEKPTGYLEVFAHLVTSAAEGSVYRI